MAQGIDSLECRSFILSIWPALCLLTPRRLYILHSEPSFNNKWDHFRKQISLFLLWKDLELKEGQRETEMNA